MKRVAYIIGAGATQAEVSYIGKMINLLMKDKEALGPGISTAVLSAATDRRKRIGKLLDSQENTDIEKLITLLAATGAKTNIQDAETLRECYYLEVTDRLKRADVMYSPKLAIGLLQMHKNSKFSGIENLLGIISLNHDNLFQEASQSVFQGINLGFEFASDDFIYQPGLPIIIQLHGSFSWTRKIPIFVDKLTSDHKYDREMTWIPPSILKETKDYPFNKLTGLGYELLLKCDILRIIGCSLSQNDWNLISLIFDAQNAQFSVSRTCFKIELIMEIDDTKELSLFKNVNPIDKLTDGDFSDYGQPFASRPHPSALDNAFEFWLKTKINYHVKQGQLAVVDDEGALKEIAEI